MLAQRGGEKGDDSWAGTPLEPIGGGGVGAPQQERPAGAHHGSPSAPPSAPSSSAELEMPIQSMNARRNSLNVHCPFSS